MTGLVTEYSPGDTAGLVRDQPVIVAGPLDRSASLALDNASNFSAPQAAGFESLIHEIQLASGHLEQAPWMVKPALAVDYGGACSADPVGRVANTLAYVRIAAAVIAIGGPAIVQPLITGMVRGFRTRDGGRRDSAERAQADPHDEPAGFWLECLPFHSR